MSGRIVQAGDVYVYGYFVASGLGATGLTVTIDVWRNRSGSFSEVVTAGSATEIGDGMYRYMIGTADVAAGDDFQYVFKTAGTADQKNVGGVVFVESNWTSAKAGYLTGDAYVRLGAPAGASVSADIAAQPASIWNYPSASATTVGSLGKRIVDYLTGDIFGRIGAPVGASISADIAALPASIQSLLTAQTITVRSPVLTRSSIEVVIGTSYRDTDGVPFEWDIGATPVLTGFTLYAKIAGVTIGTCSITNAGTATQTLTIEPTAAETATMAAGLRDFIVYAINTTPNPDATVALVWGKVNVIDAGL